MGGGNSRPSSPVSTRRTSPPTYVRDSVFVTTVAGHDGQFRRVDGLGRSIRFRSPDSLIYVPSAHGGASGTLFIVDPVDGLLRKMSTPHYDATTIAGPPFHLHSPYPLCLSHDG